MPFNLLVGAVIKLLSPTGTFNVILPFEEEESFIYLCAQGDLIPTRITHVKGTPTTNTKRSLLEFRFRESVTATKPQTNILTIEEARHIYTQEYINLTKDFYLKM